MPALDRRGLTLIELLVSLALLGIVTAGLLLGLQTSQRAYLAQAQRADLQQNLRAAAAILPAALRGLDAADSDITAMSATSITVRATEQLAFLCVAPWPGAGGAVTLSVREHPFFGTRRSFDAGDSVLLYHEGDPATRSDDSWLRGRVLAATTRDCPDPDRGRPGYEVTLRLERGGDGGVTNGSPLRGFASVTYALYRSGADNQWHLGQQRAGSPIQPLLGPLLGPSGLALRYFDSTGTPTATRTAVAEVELRVRGRTPHAVDSLVTRVALRNNPRR